MSALHHEFWIANIASLMWTCLQLQYHEPSYRTFWPWTLYYWLLGCGQLSENLSIYVTQGKKTDEVEKVWFTSFSQTFWTMANYFGVFPSCKNRGRRVCVRNWMVGTETIIELNYRWFGWLGVKHSFQTDMGSLWHDGLLTIAPSLQVENRLV